MTSSTTARNLLAADLQAACTPQGDHLAERLLAGDSDFTVNEREFLADHVADALSCDDSDVSPADKAAYRALAADLGAAPSPEFFLTNRRTGIDVARTFASAHEAAKALAKFNDDEQGLYDITDRTPRR